MKRSLVLLLAGMGAVGAIAPSVSASAQEVTVFCEGLGFGCPTMQPLADEFNSNNPGMTVNLETVTIQTILESLPVQLESGMGPDGSVVVDFGGLSRYYLDLAPYVDVERFEAEFPQLLQWLRGGDEGDAIYGMPTSQTLNGAFVNLTLFEQAGVPVPEEGATWEEWAEATRQVAEATGTDFAMEMDRSGHRFASLAISYGAELVDEEGRPVIDEGLREAIEQFVAWHHDGTMPMDLWGATGGATTRDLFTDFLNANVVFYFGGSWQLNRMDTEVGDLFEWAVVPAPCGPSSCTVMPGGGALVAFNTTDNPEVVGAFIDFLSMQENYERVIAVSKDIPGVQSVIDEGVEYVDASERTVAALESFTAQIPKIDAAAYRFQGWPFQRAMMNAMTTRIGQVLNGELTVDAALERIEADVNQAIDSANVQ
ncbi:ABC transporter substrate-binding protein [Pelagibacterium halotolerans]|nr:ABC transporter substrate-binding protein [Pelagibacterium halotolerans]QJR17674.1 carbohydrate ABC transporter substrate-binding protein [Pelagibacterium halotolerans]SEA83285.1 carbohydrate ABC transporter substrate-binding protein, CUT1 family [Pelagibacterium halotolerans]